MPELNDESVIRTPLLRRLYRYWLGRSADGRLPDRSSIDPLGIGAALLPHVMLVEFDDAADTLRYRLVGSAIVWHHGREFTGRALEDVIHPLQLDWVRGLYQAMRHERRPVYAESVYRRDNEWEDVTRRLYLPLTRGGDAIEMALSAHVYSSPPRDAAETTATRIRGATLVGRRQELLPALAS
jgi:hypothetical protein